MGEEEKKKKREKEDEGLVGWREKLEGLWWAGAAGTAVTNAGERGGLAEAGMEVLALPEVHAKGLQTRYSRLEYGL